jgi:Lysylphosphatidylglycerol synthase TM region
VKLTLRLIIAGAGLVLFAWFVHRTGVNTISRAFATLGWSAPLILLPFTLVYLLDTVGWRLCFGRTLSKAISFGTLFRIRWAGESLNNVVPSAYLGGEAVKVYLLHKRGLPVVDGASSVVIGKTAQVLAEVIFIAFGAVAGSSILPTNSPARAGMFAVSGAATAALGVQESGVIFLSYLFGFPPALAVPYAIIRRGRDLTFALIGGALLYAEEPALRGFAQRVAREVEAPA